MVGLEGPPLFPVTVCPIESLLVQTTVSPFLAVIDAGLKAKFWTVILWVTGAGVGSGVGAEADGELVVGTGVGVGDDGLVVPYKGVLFAPF